MSYFTLDVSNFINLGYKPTFNELESFHGVVIGNLAVLLNEPYEVVENVWDYYFPESSEDIVRSLTPSEVALIVECRDWIKSNKDEPCHSVRAFCAGVTGKAIVVGLHGAGPHHGR